MTKADLARAAGIQPEAVRRLFTMESPKPTAATLLAIAEALDMEVVTRPMKRVARPKVSSVDHEPDKSVEAGDRHPVPQVAVGWSGGAPPTSGATRGCSRGRQRSMRSGSKKG